MTDKFQMSTDENIILAKRTLVDAIYKSANLEGIAVTYANTNDILNNVAVSSVAPNDVHKIFCLRDAWHFVLDNITTPVDLGFLETVHELVARADVPYYMLGQLRTGDVLISGTSWRPELPDPDRLHRELSEILRLPCVTDRALSAVLWCMRSQPFLDGNKRVASLLGNKILIENGNGLFHVPVELDGQFKTRLVSFYESGNAEDLKQWLYDTCLVGVNPPTQQQSPPGRKGRTI